MKKLFLVLCVLLSACGGGGGGGDSQPQQKAEPVIEQKKVEPVVVEKTVTVFIGDSITLRWNLNKVFPGAINSGISGNYTWEMFSRFEKDVLIHNPKTVIILGGTNDVLDTQAPNVDSIYKMATKARTNGVRVILCTIPPIGQRWPITVTPAQFNAALKAMAIANGFELVDYYAVLAAANGDPLPGITWDDVHLTDHGYDLIEAELLRAL